MSDLRKHLDEHPKDPEFKAAWESEASYREQMGREAEAELCRRFGTTLEEIEVEDVADLGADDQDGVGRLTGCRKEERGRKSGKGPNEGTNV